MAQFVRPIADLDNTGVWTTAPLFSKVDDDVQTTTDFSTDVIRNDGSASAAETFTLDGSTVSDPSSSAGHILRVAASKTSGGADCTVTVQLRQGYVNEGSPGTLIATLTTGLLPVPASFGRYSLTLSAAEANSITDYSNLQFRCWADKSGGGANREVQVLAVELEVPNAGTPATVNLDTLNFTETQRDVSVTTIQNTSTTLDVLSVNEVIQNVSVTTVQNVSTTLDNLNFSESLQDISAGVSVSIQLDTLNFSESLQDVSVATTSNVSIALDALNFTETFQDQSVTAIQNTNVSLDVLNFNEVIYDIQAGATGNVDVSLDTLNFFNTLQDLGLSTGTSVLLDILNIVEAIHDIDAGGVNSTIIALDVLNINENINDISVDSGVNTIINLDTLNLSLNTNDISVDVIANIVVNLDNIDLSISLKELSTSSSFVRTIVASRSGKIRAGYFDTKSNQRNIHAPVTKSPALRRVFKETANRYLKRSGGQGLGKI